MNTQLTVNDPLADQEVTIVITLTAGEQARNERLAQVSVGVTGQAPVSKTGTFGQMAALIDQAWTAFGVQAQATAAQGAGAAGQATKPDGEVADMPALRADAASVVEVVAVPGAQETTPQPHTSAPNSQPDLSFLF
jgi:hypothetical protein